MSLPIEPDDIRVSLQVAGLATMICIVVGLPIAWLLARHQFRGRTVIEVVVTLPLLLPPTVVGYYLLRAFGRGSPLGRFLEDDLGVSIVFTWYGAALAAAIVSIPFLIRTSQSAFEAVDPELEGVAQTLGRGRLGIFWAITLPLAARGIAAGVVLAFARAIGEFGATVVVAGNIPGRTRTLPISVYDAVQAGDIDRANLTALLLVGISVASLLLFSWSLLLVRR
ncbi:MAG TPA: molybdate ABC transporter permease subunit [Dehalococcoidia bacterium]|nr:molybdate ABC transporter permease subunit [Dehalococcoidia bacterium]